MTDAAIAAAAPVPDDATASAFARKAARGALALGVRQVAVQGMNVLGGVFLARLLTPAEYGVYGIVVFLLAFLVIFGDVGLGASLVRQKEEPAREDYRAVFTAQQLLVFAAVALAWALAPVIAAAYDRPPGDAWIFRLVAASVAFTSLQSIASIRLERHLAFDRLAVVEVCAAAAFNGVAVGLAWSGAGAMSVAWALLARSVTGAVLANVVSPWPVGWRWDPERVREHLRFGVPYQGAAFVSLLKDSITPLLVGLLLGAAGVGYVQWATLASGYPAIALMVFSRVYLPAFSRMAAEHPERLGGFVEGVLRATNALVAPLAALTLALAVPITTIVFGEQWLPALGAFYLLWTGNLFIPTSGPLAGLLNALGHSGLTFRFAVLWMVTTWVLGAPLISAFGIAGFGMATIGVHLTNFLLFREARKHVEFRVLRPALPAWGAAAVAGGAVWLAARWMPPVTLWGLLAYGAIGGLMYLAVLIGLDPRGARSVRALVGKG